VRPSAPIRLTGQVALVTGASRGIGRAIAVALAREGADVAAADLTSADDTVAAVRALGRRGVAVRADVSRRASVERMLATVARKLGGPDILVNNAGVTHRDRLEETGERTWDRVVDVILKGSFLCIQAAVPGMRRRGYGKIVNIASISGIIGGAVSRTSDRPRATRGRTGPAYAAAKGGVIALTKWVAKDVGVDGIFVNAVAPGPIDTAMTRGFAYPVDHLPIARMGTPADVAEAVVFLASPASNYVTGQVLCVDGGWVM
jgi:3-oxoacyl-[acyl-carrier protein] reductase